MPESRASIIKVFNDRKGLSKKFETGIFSMAIVFDFGSSTLDWTCIDLQKGNMIEDGERLGAAYIENKMLEYILEETKSGIDDLSSPLSYTLLDLRNLKEQYYTNPNGRHVASIFKDETTIVSVNQSMMQKITHEMVITYSKRGLIDNITGTWAKLCKNFIRKTSEYQDCPYKGIVILTGGASRMEFTTDICKEIYPEQENIIEYIIDYEPSTCVSRGLAYAGRTDIEAAKLLDETATKIRAEIKSKLPNLETNLINNISDVIFSFINKKFANWVEDGDYKTLQQLQDEIQSQFKENQTYKEQITKTTKDDLNEFLNGTQNLKTIIVDKINEIFKDKYPTVFLVTDIKPFEIDDKKWESVSGALLENVKINETIYKISLDNTVVVFIKFAVSIIVLIIVSFFNEKMADQMNEKIYYENKNKIVTKKKRKKIYNKMIKNQAILPKIRSGIKSEVMTEENKNKIINTILDAIDNDLCDKINKISLHFGELRIKP
jgi:hypothetical protein